MNKHISKSKVEYIALLVFCLWIAFCSFFNLGYIAAIVFFLLLIFVAKLSYRCSFGILITLPYIPVVTLNIPNGYLMATIIVLLLNITRYASFKNKLLIKNLIIIYILFLLIRFSSIIFVKDNHLFNSYVTTNAIVLVNILVAMALVKDKEDVEFLIKYWGIIGVFASILGFLYFQFHDIAYINHIVYTGESSEFKGIVGDTYLTRSWLRWLPMGFDPNFWGVSLLIPLAYWLHTISKKITFANLSCLAINLLGIFGSYSRSSFIVACFMIFLTILRSKPKYTIVYLIVLAGFYFGVQNFFPTFCDRISTIRDNIDESGGSGRFYLWGEAFNNFLTNPIMGVGTGQTRLYSTFHLESHNLYLQILSENGIIGFILLLILILRPLRDMWRMINTNNFFFIALIGCALNIFTVSYFDLRLPFYMIILFYVYISSLQKSVVSYKNV